MCAALCQVERQMREWRKQVTACTLRESMMSRLVALEAISSSFQLLRMRIFPLSRTRPVSNVVRSTLAQLHYEKSSIVVLQMAASIFTSKGVNCQLYMSPSREDYWDAHLAASGLVTRFNVARGSRFVKQQRRKFCSANIRVRIFETQVTMRCLWDERAWSTRQRANLVALAIASESMGRSCRTAMPEAIFSPGERRQPPLTSGRR